MTRRKMTEKEIDKLLDDIRFYMAFGIFRFPVVAKGVLTQFRVLRD